MFIPFLFVAAQSVTPYGSPAPEILRPSKPRQESTDLRAEKRFKKCVDLAIDDPRRGIDEANAWRLEGGAFLARHCLGFAYAEQLDWPAATKAFVEAAREAEVERYPRTANFWAQAGNAALADGRADKALEYLNAALVQGSMKGLYKGEVHLDRARAYVALGKNEMAKEEFVQVHKLAPEDPLGWLLSATLARRMKDLQTARADIAKAAKLAGGDPAVALEAGNIAYQSGDAVAAKSYWEKAVEMDAKSPPAETAAKYLSQLVTTVED